MSHEVEIITPRVDYREQAKRDIQEKILTYLRGGATRRDAAAASGIDRVTFYRWMKSDATFATQVEMAEGEIASLMAARLTAEARLADGDWRAALEWLKRRRRDDWDEKRQVDLSSLTDEQIIRIARKLDQQGAITEEDYHNALVQG